MTKGRKMRWGTAVLVISIAALVSGCLGGQTLQGDVTTEYLLTKAGFQRWDVNMETAKKEALLSALPVGKITTYIRDGRVLYAYVDGTSKNIYVGDEAAYRRYTGLAGDRKLCERVTGPNQEQFWRCMEGSPPVGAKGTK